MLAWLADQWRMARCSHQFTYYRSSHTLKDCGVVLEVTHYLVFTCGACGYVKRKKEIP